MKEFKYPREFKGVWIPKEIWLREDLSAVDKVLLSEIWSLDGDDGCYASNEYLAEFCKVSAATLKRSLLTLEGLGLIMKNGYRGRCRVWTTKLKMSQVPGSERAKYQAQNEPPVIHLSNTDEKKDKKAASGTLLKVFDKEDYREKVKTALAKAKADYDLVGVIVKGLELLNDHPFGSYPKEVSAAKRLADKIKTAGNGSDPLSFFHNLTRAYLAKRKSSKAEFWKEAPLTPSAIDCRFDQIIGFVHKKVEDESAEQEMRDMLARRRA